MQCQLVNKGNSCENFKFLRWEFFRGASLMYWDFQRAHKKIHFIYLVQEIYATAFWVLRKSFNLESELGNKVHLWLSKLSYDEFFLGVALTFLLICFSAMGPISCTNFTDSESLFKRFNRAITSFLCSCNCMWISKKKVC